MAWQAGRGKVGIGMDRHGRRGMAWRGEAKSGVVRQARLGGGRRCLEWFGEVWQAWYSQHSGVAG